ncbi:hypothetical protein OC846_002870 [Tilletia horrida]|uniref:RRM domain-containing protein n=1 Tax=Tilletia horrida TaxID=155126 RepID=A0AAN6JRR6_9BASI|nr:hypothetical protein OC846_002870 [Tilletia horrida]
MAGRTFPETTFLTTVTNFGGFNAPASLGPYLTLTNSSHTQDLKDFGRSAGPVTFADVSRDRPGEGVIEYSSREDADTAVKTLDRTEIRGSVVRVEEDRSGGYDDRGGGREDRYGGGRDYDRGGYGGDRDRDYRRDDRDYRSGGSGGYGGGRGDDRDYRGGGGDRDRDYGRRDDRGGDRYDRGGGDRDRDYGSRRDDDRDRAPRDDAPPANGDGPVGNGDGPAYD